MVCVALQSRFRIGGILRRGEVVDVLRKFDAEDLRFGHRVDRALSQQQFPRPRLALPDGPLHFEVKSCPGGDRGDDFDASDFHREVNAEVDQENAVCIDADPGMDVDVVEADVDFDHLFRHWELNMKRQVDVVG